MLAQISRLWRCKIRRCIFAKSACRHHAHRRSVQVKKSISSVLLTKTTFEVDSLPRRYYFWLVQPHFFDVIRPLAAFVCWALNVWLRKLTPARTTARLYSKRSTTGRGCIANQYSFHESGEVNVGIAARELAQIDLTQKIKKSTLERMVVSRSNVPLAR